MKRLVIALALVGVLAVPALADNFEITMKQGVIAAWDSWKLENVTAFEVIKTKKVENWGKWNALWDGWSLDVGVAYDAGDTIDHVAVLLGRKIGVLKDYFPIEYPLADKIEISIYPVGVYFSELGDNVNVSGCSGGAIFNLSIKF